MAPLLCWSSRSCLLVLLTLGIISLFRPDPSSHLLLHAAPADLLAALPGSIPNTALVSSPGTADTAGVTALVFGRWDYKLVAKTIPSVCQKCHAHMTWQGGAWVG